MTLRSKQEAKEALAKQLKRFPYLSNFESSIWHGLSYDWYLAFSSPQGVQIQFWDPGKWSAWHGKLREHGRSPKEALKRLHKQAFQEAAKADALQQEVRVAALRTGAEDLPS